MINKVLNSNKTYLNNITSYDINHRESECNKEIQSLQDFYKNLKSSESESNSEDWKKINKFNEAYERLDKNMLQGVIRINPEDGFYKNIAKYSLWEVNKDNFTSG
jgi:uncharacterized coiled-coil DUF342 family protein